MTLLLLNSLVSYYFMMFKLIFLGCFLLYGPAVSAWNPDEIIHLDHRYCLEIDDPHHRPINMLSPVHSLWENQWKDIYPDFWEFLEMEKKHLQETYPALYDPAYHLVWLNEEERLEYEAFFVQDGNHCIHVWTPREGILKDGKWMYVQIGAHFFAGMERKYRFHHISLSGGHSVHGAGTFTIKNGRLASISTVSGHYRPTIAHGLNCINALQTLFNLDLSGLKMTYCTVIGGEVVKSKVDIEEFLTMDPAKAEEEIKTARFFAPFTDLSAIDSERVKMFLTNDGEFFVGSPKLDSEDPICKAAAPFAAQATLKLKNREIQKIMFKTPIETQTQFDEVKFFVACLISKGINLNDTRIIIIKKNEKIALAPNHLVDP